MSETFRARPTVYAGIQMRSRLEARYAAILDDLGFPWRYEPRAYGASARKQYLPDFEYLLHGKPVIAEVRPTPEGAYRAMEQMTVIWENDPHARLIVATPEMSWLADGDDRQWTILPFRWPA